MELDGCDEGVSEDGKDTSVHSHGWAEQCVWRKLRNEAVVS